MAEPAVVTEDDLFAVVTGGGTAGHVLPALSIAEAIVGAGHRAEEVLYVGAQRGIETRLLPSTPYPHVFLDVVGFQRSLTPRNLAFAPKMMRAVRQATALLRRRRPKVVVSVGGYASVPAVVAANRLKIPVVVVSFDKRPGRASQLAARKATACAVAFDGSPLPRATFTGAPVRRSILDVDRLRDRAASRRALDVPGDRFLICVFGGSQGSGILNSVIGAYVAAHPDRRDLAIRHVVGDRFLSTAAAARRDPNGILYDVIGYEDRMPLIYGACDLLVGRGGASTVVEVATTGTPAILVPWAGAAEDHQTDNIRWLSDAGAAVLIAESEFDLSRFEAVVEPLIADPERLQQLSAKAYQLGTQHRSGALVDLIRRVAEAGMGYVAE
jgi:UDP-N-acetylglucosamine--N-acetylmuramyl-(pentapeptide) pyrophosphoryl-undecaprenol N-acetylglucosamine transferase